MPRLSAHLAPLLAFALTACASSGRVSTEPTRVVVVGAGVAGLTAARALEADGVEVEVLEARDRIGGRTHTATIGGATVDVGAAWIHGPEGNPLTALAEALGIGRTPHDYDFAAIVDSEVGEVPLGIVATAFLRADELEGALPSYRSDLPEDATVADAIDAYIADADLTGADARAFRFIFEQGIIELDYAGPAAETSLAYIGEDEEFPGGDVLPDGGYAALVEPLARGLDIRLGDAVTDVAYDREGVQVTTASGEVHAGSHVIVTTPVGILQRDVISFSPALPSEKREAIDAVEMSSLEKVVFRFDDVFWTDFEGEAGVYVDGDALGRFPAFIDFTEYAGAPTLVCLYGGAYARIAQDTMTDAEIEAAALEVLGNLLEMTPPAPRETFVTRWRSDPYSFGSYSYPSRHASPAARRALAAPVEDRVLFAGEATDVDYFGTVHGALLSGLREAERLGVARSGVPGQ